MIPDSFLEELKQRCDIESLISSYVLLKRAGRNLRRALSLPFGKDPFLCASTPRASPSTASAAELAAMPSASSCGPRTLSISRR